MPTSKSDKVSTKGLAKDPEVHRLCVPMRSVYRSHLQLVLRKKLENGITPQEFLALSMGNCYYCGVPPENMTKFGGHKPIAYNGVDRIDNNFGYVPGNVETCCKDCNSMKSQLSEERFVEHANQITDYQLSLSPEERLARIEARKLDREKLRPVKPKPEPSMFDVFGDGIT